MASTATTECTITNDAGQNLVLALSNYETAAETIKNTETATFTLTMPAIYLNGALVYEVGHSLRWIIFWTTDNQVSTKMFKINDPIDWKQVANNLKYGHKSEDRIIYADSEYTAWASIEPNSKGQVLTANIYASSVPK
ncbi:hypothetical protein CXB51_010778 [Gossypium anomalum]|uniref:Uncharacterized protein LOC107904404 n=6 Tax=Gossypium TaxID=3633 RepID=A0A1U8J7D4_GOSHI|nr:uncharacterized protein LOC107904404 [Gossypium hirsutum]XP_016686257.1 uncharacterized protein LOC107904406 [Gossypium hirsutum]XP_040968206.1 uncharacterized protein LOC121229072 [Gossypium hirsutum]KAG8493440.1 hypothetical protein CXB51_010778 [Gossypium anomalum]PPS09164.1 hypothetical protein GOBAR_AA11466 [Gossypium barbadense]TXG75397.1 hypothetical protein E1A91_1Z018400v1 [Gossypium mustelinum]TYH18889.1 hypothetical protein ES288_A05G309000v1 [Gossypium darwinii]TYI29381.1 hypo